MKITSSWRRGRRSIAAAVALTMGGATLTASMGLAASASPIGAGVAATDTAAASAQDVVDGSLEWGLRTSYRNYITSPIAHGQIVASDGAVWLDGPGRGKGPFTFAGGTGTLDPDAGTGEVSFGGSVYTAGHDYGSGPILELTLSDPRLRIAGDSAELVVDAAYRPFVGASPDVEPPPVETADDLVFGTVDLSGADLTPDADGVVTVENAPVVGDPDAMTAVGWDLFYSAEMPAVALDPVSFSVTVAEQPTWEPALQVFAADGEAPLPDTVSPGEEIVVRGSGFDPAANPATGRPPIPTGVPAGVYVVFGKFADVWRPSAGAPSSARTVIDQRWALPESSLEQVPEQYQEAIRAQWVELRADGTFEARLTVGEDTDAAGAYGVYTYAAGGAAANPAHELAVPVSVAADGDPTTISDATFEWGINNVSQTGSPAGGCGFFVAGIADGTEESYATSDGDVHLFKRLADGRATAVTAQNRCTPLIDNFINQRVMFTGGDGTTDPATGATTIAWTGAFTIYSYGGLVPWYVKDPVLTVDAEGHGTITAEVGGFSSSMENPDVKVPLDPEPGVTILELADVQVGDTVTGTPVYAGVDYVPLVDAQDPASGRQVASAIPDSVKAADPAWGSWPTPLVDFHYRTGLTSYWHSSGTATDQHKPPLPVVIDLDGGLPDFVEVDPVTITTQPASVDVVLGGSATFAVTADSADALTYQWQRREPGTTDIPANWHDVDGATTATLTVSGVTEADHRALYRVKVSGATTSVTSAVARLAVGAAVAPAWRSEPADVTTYAGYRADFTVSAIGFPAPTYRWQTSSDGGQTWSDHGTATKAGQLRLSAVTAAQDALLVRAVASNGAGEDIVSATGTLTVLATPTAPALTLPAGVEYDLTQDVNIPALGGGFPVPPAPVTLAVVDASVWAQRGADFDVRAVSEAWIEASVFSFTDGFLQAGLYVPAGTLDPEGDYVFVTTSVTAGDRTRDAAVPLPLAGSGPQPSDGFLDWGLKASFRQYVEGPIAHGGIEVRDPATTNDDGTYRFGEGAGTGDAAAAEVAFTGEVYFWGHDAGSGPQLELTLSEPRVEVAGQTGTLVADVASRSLSSGEVVTYDDVAVAQLDFAAAPVTVTDGVISAQDVPATLTADGVPAFADFYPEGTALDPVSFEAPIEDGPQEPSPVVTVSEVTDLDPYADLITVTGSGFDPEDLADGLRVGVGARTSDGSVPELNPVVTVTPGSGALSAAFALVRGSLLAADGAFEVQLVTGTVEPGTELAVHTAPVEADADAAYTTQTGISFAAARTPALTVTPTTDLEVGQTVEITGSGFAPNRPISIAITANDEQDPTYGWPTGWLGHEVVRAGADGTVHRTLTLSGTVTGADGAGADCAQVPCFVAAFSSAQEGDATPVDYRADRSQDVFVPITFAGGDPAPEPTLTITPSTVPQGESLAFAGSGLEPGGTASVVVDAEPPGPGPDPVGALDWGVKASFRAYVEGPIANGSIEVADPASRNADGTVRFGAGDGSGDETALQAGFGGTVTFAGHEGALRLEISDPRVDIDGAAGTLIADVRSKSLESGELEEYDDVALADLDLSAAPVQVADGVATATAVPATLTEAGAPAFAGFYEAGEALDPVTFSVPLTTGEAEPQSAAASSVEVGSATVAADGTVALTWTVPADFATGAHTATVTAGEATATASFEVEAAGPDPDPDPDPDPKAAVSVDPEEVERGTTATISGTGYDAGEKVTAAIGVDPAEATYSFDNGSGQSVTVTSADDNPLAVRDGRLVVVDGATLAVTLAGLDGAEAPAGFYLMTAVDNGPGEVATPAIGGVDMTGASHTSRWITNEPYAGSENAVVPIAADGSAQTELQVVAADDHADCAAAAAPDGCVLYLRADHRAAAERGYDLRVPLEFGTAAEVAALATTASVELDGTVDADGTVALDWTVPADFALGTATVTVSGTTSQRVANTQFVIIDGDDSGGENGGNGDHNGTDAGNAGGTASGADAGGTPLPDTGGAPWWLAAVAVLLLLSGGVALATRPGR